MNVTKMINKLYNDYQNSDLIVNSAIKYRFVYNGFQTDIFYTLADGLHNQLLIVITVNNVDYLTTLYFLKNQNNEFFMKPYLPPELYHCVQFTLLYKNGKCSTTPYFEQIQLAILNTLPIPSNHKEDIAKRHLYNYHEQKDNPFFETVIRRPMSANMITKIKSKYEYPLAQQILRYCGHTKTLRFTSDFSKPKDILTFINQPR